MPYPCDAGRGITVIHALRTKVFDLKKLSFLTVSREPSSRDKYVLRRFVKAILKRFLARRGKVSCICRKDASCCSKMFR
jgi:hypothetical protein